MGSDSKRGAASPWAGPHSGLGLPGTRALGHAGHHGAWVPASGLCRLEMRPDTGGSIHIRTPGHSPPSPARPGGGARHRGRGAARAVLLSLNSRMHTQPQPFCPGCVNCWMAQRSHHRAPWCPAHVLVSHTPPAWQLRQHAGLQCPSLKTTGRRAPVWMERARSASEQG